MISIITATKNAIDDISNLVNSLLNQTSKDFVWIVVDSKSTDGTFEYLSKIEGINIIIKSEEDFGIYDALNKGVKFSKTDSYLVLGADDKLNCNAVEYINGVIAKENFDVLSCTLSINGKNFKKKRSYLWFNGHKAVVTEHAVSTVFKKDLHEKFGDYSNKYPIAADMHFILKAYLGNAKFIYHDQELGEYGVNGVSSTRHLDVICQQANVKIELGFNKNIQLTLLLLRIIKLIIRH